MKSIQLSMLTLLSLPLFSGCTPYSESFDCPPGHGVGCKSLSEVNQMVETGKLPLGDKSRSHKEASPVSEQPRPIKKSSRNVCPRNSLIEAKMERTPGPIDLLHQHTVLRSKPDAQFRIWLAAYEDDGDSSHRIYHAPSYVYASLKHSPRSRN